MKKAILVLLLASLSACTSLAPPHPPVINNGPEGMRPINPQMISPEAMATWQKEVAEVQAQRAREAEAENAREI